MLTISFYFSFFLLLFCFSMPLTKFEYSYYFKHFLVNARSRINTYDEVVGRIARQLKLNDPSKIRLTSHNCLSQQPKPQPIKYRGLDFLVNMLFHNNKVSAKIHWIMLCMSS